MSIQDTIFQIISFKSFSNVWYWLSMAVTWSMVSHWILGVPFDMIFRARRNEGADMENLEAIVTINVRRLMLLSAQAGLGILGLTTFVLSSLAMCGFYYGFEFAQGILCIGAPLTVVFYLNLRLARKFAVVQPTGADLVATLMRMRFIIQSIAMVAIFFTAMYGMYRTLSLPLGF